MGYINLDNIFGYRIPEWVHNQLMVRSKMNSKDVRDDANLLYLANKTGWVRLVSSIDIKTNSGNRNCRNCANERPTLSRMFFNH